MNESAANSLAEVRLLATLRERNRIHYSPIYIMLEYCEMHDLEKAMVELAAAGFPSLESWIESFDPVNGLQVNFSDPSDQVEPYLDWITTRNAGKLISFLSGASFEYAEIDALRKQHDIKRIQMFRDDDLCDAIFDQVACRPRCSAAPTPLARPPGLQPPLLPFLFTEPHHSPAPPSRSIAPSPPPDGAHDSLWQRS